MLLASPGPPSSCCSRPSGPPVARLSHSQAPSRLWLTRESMAAGAAIAIRSCFTTRPATSCIRILVASPWGAQLL